MAKKEPYVKDYYDDEERDLIESMERAINKDGYTPVSSLVENELDRRIAKGRQDIKDGNFTPVNARTTADFISSLSKKILSKK